MIVQKVLNAIGSYGKNSVYFWSVYDANNPQPLSQKYANFHRYKQVNLIVTPIMHISQNSLPNQTICQLYSSTLSFSKKLAQEAQSTRETSLLDHYMRVKTAPEQHESDDEEFNYHSHPFSSQSIYKKHDSPHLKQQSQSTQLDSYKSIESILTRENDNLKQQNMFLLNEVYRLRKTNNSYKTQYLHKKLEVEEYKTQCVAYKKRADDLKEIIMAKLSELQEELGAIELNKSERSILEILNLMDSNDSETGATKI